MRLAVSNIAWDRADDEAAAAVLRSAGIDAVELAPTKTWPDLREADVASARDERDRWRERGLTVLSTQSLLFGRPDLQLFGGEQAVEDLLVHLELVLGLGAAMGAGPQVFGSPKNRRRGELPLERALPVAVDAFTRVAAIAEALGTTMVLEANPQDYGADFVTSAHEAASLVAAVGRPGLRLHLDTACMSLAGDDAVECVHRYAHLLAHVHLSEPDLGEVGVANPVHVDVVRALKDVGYMAGVTVEMRPAGDPLRGLRRAAEYAVRLLDTA